MRLDDVSRTSLIGWGYTVSMVLENNIKKGLFIGKIIIVVVLAVCFCKKNLKEEQGRKLLRISFKLSMQ